MPSRFYTAFNAQGRILWQSRVANGYKSSEMIGTFAWDWVQPNEADKCKVAISRAIVTSEVVSCSFHGSRDNQEYELDYLHLAEPAVLMAECRASVKEKLTDRELSVLMAICADESPTDTATRLKVSVSTIEAFRATLKRKLNARGTAGLVRAAIRMGLVHVAICVAHFECAVFGMMRDS